MIKEATAAVNSSKEAHDDSGTHGTLLDSAGIQDVELVKTHVIGSENERQFQTSSFVTC